MLDDLPGILHSLCGILAVRHIWREDASGDAVGAPTVIADLSS